MSRECVDEDVQPQQVSASARDHWCVDRPAACGDRGIRRKGKARGGPGHIVEQRVCGSIESIAIRAAMTDDASAIASLLGQLGYPSGADDVVARLARLDAFGDAIAHVADSAGQVVGVVTCHVFPSIHAPDLVAWVTTLVVDDRHHQKGVGRRLTAAVEQWARERGAVRISVTSGKQRQGAHAFYESVGYELTGVRLSKSLG